MKKQALIWTAYAVWKPFEDLFTDIKMINKEIKKTDVVIFEGGTDISSFLYNEPKLPNSDAFDIDRDRFETSVFNQAVKAGASMLGICRGSQFLTAMNGGTVIRHCDNHTKYHWIRTSCKKDIWVSSTHHQMMNPFRLPKNRYKLLAWASPRLSTEYLNGWNQNIIDKMPCEPEIVWYPKTKCLCIQGHPEYMKPTTYIGGEIDQIDPFVYYCRKLIQKYLL